MIYSNGLILKFECRDNQTLKPYIMIKLTVKEAFELAEKFTKSTSKQINSYWLQNNGYTKKRIQKDKIRQTYYCKSGK